MSDTNAPEAKQAELDFEAGAEENTDNPGIAEQQAEPDQGKSQKQAPLLIIDLDDPMVADAFFMTDTE